MLCVHTFQHHLGCLRVLNMIKQWALLKILLEGKSVIIMPLDFLL